MARPDLSQHGAENSTNYQAGNDIHVHGLSLQEARTVAIDVFRANARELAGIAQAVAAQRAEELTSAYLSKLESDRPERVNELATPDMQNMLFEAQKEYARSGEEDLREALVDLLSARSEESERNLRTLALNEAIISAPKLTEQQRRAIAWIFYLRYSRSLDVQTPEGLYGEIRPVVDALGVNVPRSSADYQHIEYVGAGSAGVGLSTFGKSVAAGHEGLFTKGFMAVDVKPDLLVALRENHLVGGALRDANRLQLSAGSEFDLTRLVESAGMSDRLPEIRVLMGKGRMSDDEIADEVVRYIPEIQLLRETWDSNEAQLKSLNLTSVGIALGHAYWSRFTGNKASLKRWLP
ncbi:hypothetical protein GCM10009808_15480 [Microbacterium sediminicola]|uniref:Uncharacterized protein n=1 Tax=Microbacterium sediminicola TaxID=415210 RepID=A0ABN2I5A8_9MICO